LRNFFIANIGGIVDAVKNIINKIVGPIHKAIDKMVDWLKGVLNKVVDKVKGVFGKKEEKKPAEKEQRSQEQMQKDLNSGVGEATSYLRSGDSKKKDDINKHFATLESKYGLTDLTIVTTKHNENGKDTVHVHGKVNPEKDGENVEVDFKNDVQLSTEEKSILTKLPGGKDKLTEIVDMEKGGSSKAKNSYAEVRTALDAVNRGQLNVKIGTDIFASIGANGKLTEIDIITNDEMIEVKSGSSYNKAKKLSGSDFDQFLIFRDIFKGKRKVVDSKGNSISVPKKWVYQFRINNVDSQLIKWLLEKDVTEVRQGKN
jgi:hypothetical protein